MDMDVDMDDAVPFSEEDWTNGEEEDMEWDAAVLEAALHELDHLRRGPVPEGSNATPRPTHERSLLDTNDAGLSHADGGVMSTTHEHGRSLGPSVVTIVPDTNVLVHEGGASLERLLGRFRARIGADGSVTRARVAVPRKVVQELDGLKNRASGAGSGAGDRRSEVAALARSVNRALQRRLAAVGHTREREQVHAGGDFGDDAELLVQGPADAGAMRVRMRAEGLGPGQGPGGDRGGGDEEIVYFCQRRRRLGEVVVLLTADVNAAVTAASVAGPGDVPVCTFHPGDCPNDVAALLRAAGSFYAGAEERVWNVGEKADFSGLANAGVVPVVRPPPKGAASTPGSDDSGGTVSAGEAVSPASRVSRVLDALDAAFPRGGGHVEGGSRRHVARGRAGRRRGHTGVHPGRRVRGVAEEPHDPRRRPGPAGVPSGVTLARRWSPSPSRGGAGNVAGDGGFGDRANALGVAAAACDVLAFLPRDIPEVAAAAEVAAGHRRELAG